MRVVRFCDGQDTRSEDLIVSRGGGIVALLKTARLLETPLFQTQGIRKGEYMRTKIRLLAFAVLFAAVAVCVAAEDVNMGTWKLDETKSRIVAGTPKNTTVVYEAAGDSVKVTVDGVGADGKPSHNEWTGKFDGKDYPLTGDPTADMRSYKKVSAHTLALTNKKDGKVTLTGTVKVSADGKTRTVAISGMDSKGKKGSSTAVYDKQ
jgi:hypothetical protein